MLPIASNTRDRHDCSERHAAAGVPLYSHSCENTGRPSEGEPLAKSNDLLILNARYLSDTLGRILKNALAELRLPKGVLLDVSPIFGTHCNDDIQKAEGQCSVGPGRD